MRTRLSTATVAVVGAVSTVVAFGAAGCAENPQPTVLTGPTNVPTEHSRAASPKPSPSHAAHSGTPTQTHSTSDSGEVAGKTGKTKTTGAKSTPKPVSEADQRAGEQTLAQFFTAVNKANTSGDVKPLESMWQASCIWCGTYVNAIDEASFASWKHVGGHVSQPKITFQKRGSQGQILYRVRLSVSAMKIVDDKGKTRDQQPAVHDRSYTFSVTHDGGHWQVAQGQTGRIK